MSGAEVGAIEAASLQSASSLTQLNPWTQQSAMEGNAVTGLGSFAQLIAQGIDQVNHDLVSADAALTQAALDGTEPPHQVMLALEEARLSFQLALQVRTRLLEGYQELMRMQV